MASVRSVPERFLFAFRDRGCSFAVAIDAGSHAEAFARFRAMSGPERRQRIVGQLDQGSREPDAALWLVDRVRSLFWPDRKAA